MPKGRKTSWQAGRVVDQHANGDSIVRLAVGHPEGRDIAEKGGIEVNDPAVHQDHGRNGGKELAA
jgi:hypothetical protein